MVTIDSRYEARVCHELTREGSKKFCVFRASVVKNGFWNRELK
jgi:hypothetical protein